MPENIGLVPPYTASLTPPDTRQKMLEYTARYAKEAFHVQLGLEPMLLPFNGVAIKRPSIVS